MTSIFSAQLSAAEGEKLKLVGERDNALHDAMVARCGEQLSNLVISLGSRPFPPIK